MLETKLKTGIPGIDLADLSKPSLHALSYALRHPDTWPKDFIWNYNECEKCAMGLAHQLWAQIPQTKPATAASIMARAFAMPYEAARSIFLGDWKWVPKREITKGHLWWKKNLLCADHSRVSPEMVADQIDAYLARAE